jgi:hypothetical protein
MNTIILKLILNWVQKNFLIEKNNKLKIKLLCRDKSKSKRKQKLLGYYEKVIPPSGFPDPLTPSVSVMFSSII